MAPSTSFDNVYLVALANLDARTTGSGHKPSGASAYNALWRASTATASAREPTPSFL